MATPFSFKELFSPSASKSGTPATTSPTLGINISASDGINTELAHVTSKLRSTNKKYTDEIVKYKEIAEFNKSLSASYMQNIKAMINVSQLLEQYANIFNVLKEETDKLEKALGVQLNVQDFQYLENMTKDKMAELNDKFIKETDSLKKVFDKYGKKQESEDISNAQLMMKKSLSNAANTYNKLVTIDKEQQQQQQQRSAVGGARLKTKRVLKTNTTKKNTTKRVKKTHVGSKKETKGRK